jgi:hypothetical protein
MGSPRLGIWAEIRAFQHMTPTNAATHSSKLLMVDPGLHVPHQPNVSEASVTLTHLHDTRSADEISSMSQTEPMVEPGEFPRSDDCSHAKGEQPKLHDVGFGKALGHWIGPCTPSLLAAVISVAALAYSLRYGIELTPDGWAYWQSSVNLLEGRGYRYFFGPTVIEWPPLYPLYLAGWEYFLGVSGRTLVLANIALAGIAAFNWTGLFLWPLWNHARGTSYSDERPFAGASGLPAKPGAPHVTLAFASFIIVIFVSSTIVSFYRSVLAQNVVYAVLPVLFYAAFRSTEASGRVLVALAGLNGLLATVLLLAHNSAVAFLLPVAAVLAGCRKNSPAIRAFAILLSSVLPLFPWLLVRSWLGQLQSHPVGLGLSNFTLAEYLDQMIGDTADLLLTIRFGLGFVALLFVIGHIWHQLTQLQRSSIIGSAIRTYLLLSVIASLCLLVIFMATWINDPLGTRFILFLPLTLFGSAACLLPTSNAVSSSCGTVHDSCSTASASCGTVSRPCHSEDRRSPGRPIAWAFTGTRPYFTLSCVAAVAAIRLAFWTTYEDPFARDFRIPEWRPGERYPNGAFKDFTIDPRVTGGPPIVRGNKMAVPPPCYRWIELRMQEGR